MKKFFKVFGILAAGAAVGAAAVAAKTTEKGQAITKSVVDGTKNLWVKITQKNQEVINQE